MFRENTKQHPADTTFKTMAAEILIAAVKFSDYVTNATGSANIIQFLYLVKADNVIHIIIDLI